MDGLKLATVQFIVVPKRDDVVNNRPRPPPYRFTHTLFVPGHEALFHFERTYNEIKKKGEVKERKGEERRREWKIKKVSTRS